MPADLPDDSDLWPADPFDILGVRPGADEKDVKRAYTRLVRRFKPEHAPDAFRKLREAYEVCLTRTGWYRDDEPEPEPEPIRLPRPEPPADAAPVATPEPERPRPAPVIDPAERLWALAVEGRTREAYRGLADLAAADPTRADLPLRLYWLLAVTPAVDPDRTRHDWLAAALTRSGLRDPAAELYRRELDADPVPALSGPYAAILSAPAPTDALLSVVRWRVAAAGRQGNRFAVESDLAAVRGRLVHDNEAAWLGLLLNAYDWLAWTPDRHDPRFLSDEFAALRHLELSHAHAFDRLDESRHLAAELSHARRLLLPDAVLDLARVARAGYYQARPEAVAAAATAINRCATGTNFAQFDELVGQGKTGVLGLAAGAMEYSLRTGADDGEFPPDRLCELARHLPDLGEYPLPRSALLRLLTENAIDPRELAAACEADGDDRLRALTAQAAEDLPLRLIWLASRCHPTRSG